MTITAIKSELESLPADDQDRILKFLSVLRLKREGLDPKIWERLDDADPENWVEWGDAKKLLEG